MKSIKLPSLLFLIAFFVASCGTPPPSNQSGSNQNTNIEIQITGTEPIELGTETISQPNCTGTAEVENSIEKSRTIQYVIEVQNGASVNANGQVGFAGTDVELGATVASQLGQSYGTSETLTRSITVKAKPESSMQHVIRQVEIWKIGQAKISVGGQQTIIPFKFRSDFAIELVNSQNIYPNGCDTLPETVESPLQQNVLDCSFITELMSKADIIQNLYDGQSLVGVQARLLYSIDVPIGWTVQYGSKDYPGPVHFDSGIVASFWSPFSCRPLSIGSNSTSNDSRDIAAQALGFGNLDEFMQSFGISDEVKSRIFVCPGEETWCLSVFEEPGQPDFHFKNISSCTIDGKQAGGISTIPEGFDGMIKGFTIRPCR
jgi:hypothetical protein